MCGIYVYVLLEDYFCTTYLSGSLGNLKNAKSDWVLFRVQFGAAQKFGMLHSRRPELKPLH